MPLESIMHELRIANHTANDWASFCREIAEHKVFNVIEKIGGEGEIVEIDESKFGKRKYYRGHRVEGQWVFGGIQRGSPKCFLVPVDKRDRETLLPIIKAWILPGTTVVSDFWKAYDCLTHEGYKHLKVNHSVNFKDPETGAHTNTQEGLWRQVKHSMPQYHRKKSHFNGYLAKFVLLRQFKERTSDVLLEFLRTAGRIYNPLMPKPHIEDDSEEEEDYEIYVEGLED